MKNILIGLVLVFLDIDLNFGVGKMDLLPDPIGFLFVLEGFQSLQNKNLIFKNLVEHGTLMAIYSSFLYVFNLFGFYLGGNGIVGLICDFLCAIHLFYVLYQIISGIKDLEAKNGADFNSEKLTAYWKAYLITYVVTSIVLFALPSIAFVVGIISAGFGIAFLVSFSKTKNAYLSAISVKPVK